MDAARRTDRFRAVDVERGRIPLRRPARSDGIAAAEALARQRLCDRGRAVLPVDGNCRAAL